jgi:hypothetical protein
MLSLLIPVDAAVSTRNKDREERWTAAGEAFGDSRAAMRLCMASNSRARAAFCPAFDSAGGIESVSSLALFSSDLEDADRA